METINNGKKEIFGDNEFVLTVTKISSLMNEMDNTYYYYINEEIKPLIATLTITNTKTNSQTHYQIKTQVCGDLEAYMYQYSEENEDYISIKNDSKAIINEAYERQIELDYYEYRQLTKTYPNKTLLELEEFIYLDKNPWMEVWIFDENNEFFCHLENWYFCSLKEVLDLKLSVFEYAINETKKKENE